MPLPPPFRAVTVSLLLGAALGVPSPTAALVRFGPNVFVGGHDFSHRTFGPRHRAIIFLYRGTPRREGCRTRADGRGGRVDICRLRQIR